MHKISVNPIRKNTMWIYPILSWGYFILFATKTNGLYSFPSQELAALQALYNSADGLLWEWNEPYNMNGYPWNFSSFVANPCTENWQGINCSTNCQTAQCYTTALRLPDHNLMGNIPQQLGNLSSLLVLDLDSNHLSGTIPPQLSNLKSLLDLDLYNNKLTGPIPPDLGNLKELWYLELDTNHLSGTIPPELGGLPELFALYLNKNELSGTIPPELGSASLLLTLCLYLNQLSGTIPPQLSNLSSLLIFDLDTNQLSGAIPPELGDLAALEEMLIFANKLTGSITPKLGNLKFLVGLYLLNNQLSGTIPRELGNLSSLRYLHLDTNQLVGTIPSELCNSSLLQELLLYNNMLSGTIPSCVGHQKDLNSVYLFNNQLTGSIPSDMFNNRSSLRIFVVSQNCLTGPIPESMCLNQAFSTIILDGMGTAKTCRKRIFPHTTNQAYTVKTTFNAGTIPTCLVQLPKLRELQLSGLSLTGSIPEIQSLSKSLQVFSVSNNRLTSAIPAIYLRHNLSLVDLSFNQINGFVNDDIFLGINGTLRMQINRLSGSISLSLQSLENINVLDGNMFACNYEGAMLPQHDPNVNSYECGSDYVNIIFVVWIAIAVACVVPPFWKERRLFGSFNRNHSSHSLEKYLSLVQHGLNIFGSMTICCLLLMCVYALLKAQPQMKTYTNQYAWTFSSCFLTGVTPAVVLFIAWSCILGFILFLPSNSITQQRGSIQFIRFKDLVGALVLVAVVSCVNGAYVYGLQQNLDRKYSVLMIIGLSIFKTVTLHAAHRAFRHSASKYLLVSVLVYCQILAPYWGELIVSTNCFYYAVLETPPSVKYVIPIQSCTFGPTDNFCHSVPTAFSYAPPYTYSFTCSSSLITTFGYVFALRYVWVLLSVPLQYMLEHSKERNMMCLKYLVDTELLASSFTSRLENLIITLIVDLAVLLTFGVLFPPLGLVICFTVLVRFIQNRLHMQYLLDKSNEDQSNSDLLSHISAQCDESKTLLLSSLPYLGILSACFWAFALFDTMAGDAASAINAVGIVVAMCASPILWMIVFWIARRHRPEKPVLKVDDQQHNPMLQTTMRETELTIMKKDFHSESGLITDTMK